MRLAAMAVAFGAGVVLGAAFDLPVWLLLFLAIAIAGVAIPFRRRKRDVGLVLAALLLGCARSPHPPGPATPADLRYYGGRVVTLQGTVAAEPDTRATSTSYLIQVRSLTQSGRARPVTGQLDLRLPLSQTLDYGETVTLTGMLTSTDHVSTVYRRILQSRGIDASMRYPRVLDNGPSDQGIRSVIVALRQHIEQAINAWMPEPEAALLIAIALGSHSNALGDLTSPLIATGLIHIIAISGIKVALVAGMIYQAGRLTRNRLLALLVGLTALLVYVVLTGATPSGERSALMWSLVFIATYLGRGTVTLISLSLVAALMVGVDPRLPWDIGFQLSVCGTFAIVGLAGPIQQLVHHVPSPFREAFAVSLAAQIGTFPIVVSGFHIVSIIGVVANVLVLPLLPLLILLGFGLGFAGGISILAAPLASAAYVLTHAVVLIALALASIPGSRDLGSLPLVVTLVYYACVLGVAAIILRRAHWAPRAGWSGVGREMGIASVIVVSSLTVVTVWASNPATPTVTWLGSGQAIVVQAEGKVALIDGSPQPLDLLERLGRVLPSTSHTIDLLVVTDPRGNNMLGLREVMKHYHISEVLAVGVEYPSRTYATWLDDLRRRHVPTYALTTGASTRIGSVPLQVMAPDGLYPNPSDGAGIIRLSGRDRSVMLATAADPREQTEALFRSPSLRADMLISGSSIKPVAAFVHAVHPRLLLSGSGNGLAPRWVKVQAGSSYSVHL